MGTIYVCGGGGDDDDDLPAIEEVLYTTLQKEGFATEDRRLDNTVLGVEEVALEERGSGFINRNGSASGDIPGGCRGKQSHYPPL